MNPLPLAGEERDLPNAVRLVAAVRGALTPPAYTKKNPLSC